MPVDLEAELDAAQQAYLDNAGYHEGAGSTTMAQAFVTACRKLKLLLPKLIRQGGRFELQFDARTLDADIAAAKQHIASHAPDGVIGYDFDNFRN